MDKATDIPEMSDWTDEQIDAWLENHDVSQLIEIAGKRNTPVIHTTTGMPKISKATLESIFSRYADRKNEQELPDWGEHLESIRKRLVDEDENLVRFMEFIVGKNFSKAQYNKAFECLIGMYALIEHQVESNELSAGVIETKSKKQKPEFQQNKCIYP